MKSRTLMAVSDEDGPSGAEIVGRLDRHHQEVCSSERELLRAIVECDRRGLWEGNGSRSYPEWLSARHGISNWKARRLIEAGYALEALPLTAAALSSGALHLDKVMELARFATPDTEKKLVSWARRVSPAAIRRRGDAKEKAKLEEATAAYERRSLRSWWDMDGTGLVVEGFLPPAEGAAFRKAIDRLAYSLPEAPPEEDGSRQDETTSIEQRRADALCLMASALIAEDQNPDLATVVVNVPWEALENETYGAHIEGGPQLHPETVRRLTCECRLQPLATGKNGDIGIGQVSHNVPRWLRRLVLKRDKDTCVFPGCEQKVFLHPHHVQHWTRDRGPTQLVNLLTLCSGCHTRMHEGGWSVILDALEGPIFFRPSGRRYDPSPPGVDEAMHDQLERETSEARPPPTRLEEMFDIENYRFREIALGFTDDMYEVARNLAGD